MRELSKEEQDFINKKLNSKGNRKLAEVKKETKRRRRKHYLSPFLRLSNWIAVLLTIPIFFIFTFTVNFSRLESMFGGKDNTLELAQQGMPKEYETIMRDSGFDWVTQMIDLYNYRLYIYGGCLSLIVLIIASIFVVRTIENRKLRQRNQEESEERVENEQ